MADYNEQDFPWTFYFNGVAMPKWGACWPEFTQGDHRNWEWEIGPRDFYIIQCKIDRIGCVESANPHSFLYAVQELLCLLFTEEKFVMEHCGRIAPPTVEPEEIYQGLIEAAFQMRTLVRREQQAFWTSGYEADRLSLLEAIRRAALPANDPQHQPPPHIQARANHLKMLWQLQLKTLHQAAATRNLPQEMRKKLLEL